MNKLFLCGKCGKRKCKYEMTMHVEYSLLCNDCRKEIARIKRANTKALNPKVPKVGKCVICGIEREKIHKHHIAHEGQGCIEITAAICPPCHGKVHTAIRGSKVFEYENPEHMRAFEAFIERYYNMKITWKKRDKPLTKVIT